MTNKTLMVVRHDGQILSKTLIFPYNIKGSINNVANALIRIREVNMLSFTEITSDLYDHLQGKYPDDSYLPEKDHIRYRNYIINNIHICIFITHI